MDRVTLSTRPDPFELAPIVRELDHGVSLADIVGIAAPGMSHDHVVVTLDGREIAPGDWSTIPAPGSKVALVIRPAGGSVGRSIALFAIAVAAAGTGQWWLAAGGSYFGATVAATSVAVLGSLAVNSLFPPPQLAGTDFRRSQNWSIDRIGNRLRPYDPIPLVLGRVRVFPPLCAQPRWSVGQGNQDVRLALCWGYGPLQVTDVKLGNTPISSLSNIVHEFWSGDRRNGVPTFTVYSKVASNESVDAQFPNADSSWIQRQTAPDATEAELIFVFTGMLRLGRRTGDRLFGNAWLQIETSPAGLGQWTRVVDEVVRAKTVQPFRRSFRFPVSGATDIRVRRLKSGGQSVSQGEHAQWLWLVSLKDEQPVATSGVAASVLLIEATDDVSGSIDQISGIVTSVLPDWDGTQWVERATRNPASLALHILRGADRSPVPDTDIDWAAFEAWHDYCTANGLTCDLYVDWAATTDELLRIVASCGHAALVPLDGRWRPIIDQARSPVAVFTPRNMAGFRLRRLLAEVPHALRIQFVDAARDYQRHEILVYRDGYGASNAQLFDTLELPGVTDATTAWRTGRRRLRELETRRDRVSFTAGIDHMAAAVGDVVLVSHHLVDRAIGYGRIVSVTTDVSGDVLSVDLDVSIEGYQTGVTYSATIRSVGGIATYALAASTSGRTLDFSTPIPTASAPAIDDLVIVGEASTATRDMIVMSVAPREDETAIVECVPYDTSVYASLTETPPSEVTAPPVLLTPAPPLIRSITVSESSDGSVRAVVALEYPDTRPDDATGVVIQWRARDTGDEWSEVRVATTAQTVSLADLARGVVHDARVRWESATAPEWSSLVPFDTTIYSTDDATPEVVTADGTDQTAGLSAYLQGALGAGESHIRYVTPPGKRVRVDGLVRVEQPDPGRSVTIDLSRASIDAGKDFRLSVRGRPDEQPETGQFKLAQDALKNAATIRVDTGPQGGDDNLLQVGRKIILRGQNDAAGNILPDQKHECEITSKTTVDSTTVDLGIDPVLPADFLVSYPASEWVEDGGGVDQTHITVLMEIDLSDDAAAGDTSVGVADDPISLGFRAGDWVVVIDDRTAGDIQGSSGNEIRREINRIKAIPTSSMVTLEYPLERDFATTWKARLLRMRPVRNVTVICPCDFRYAEPSDPPPARRQPAFELRYSVGCRLVEPTLDEEATGVSTRGQLVRVEHSWGFDIVRPRRVCRRDTSDAGSGDRYGVYVTHSRQGRIVDGYFERCRHGVACTDSIDIRSIGGSYVDCLINGWDTHGGQSVRCRSVGEQFIAGPSRPPDANNQSAVTIGNTAHQAGDYDCGVIGGTFRGFTGSDGAIEVRIPSRGTTVQACAFHGCRDAIRIKETGTVAGGDLFVDDIAMIGCSGYAVKDDITTAGLFDAGTIRIGTVQLDGSAAGVHAEGAGGPAKRPDLVPDKGAIIYADIELAGTAVDLTTAELSRQRNKAVSFDETVVRVWPATPGNDALIYNLPKDAPAGAKLEICIPWEQTGSVTIGLVSGASFRAEGVTSYTAMGPPGPRSDRKIVAECMSNPNGSAAVWQIDGDILWPDGVALPFDLRLVPGALGEHENEVITLSGAATLGEEAMGLIVRCTGSAPYTVILDDTSGKFHPTAAENCAICEIHNDTGGSVTVQDKAGTTSVTLTAGQWARAVKFDSATLRLQVM